MTANRMGWGLRKCAGRMTMVAAMTALGGCMTGGGYGLPPLPASQLPAGWSPHGARGAAQCGVENSSIRFVNWAIGGSQDIFGQGYANYYTGFVFAPPRTWPQFQSAEARPDDVEANVVFRGRMGTRRIAFKLMGHRGGLVFARLAGGSISSIDMFQMAMASGDITVELPQNFRGYPPAHIQFDGNAGRRAYAWMRQTCDGYSTPAGYING
ncbi:hypothetical protein [Sphingosinithalassobacter portus]|uniref:hypothetical protein n=1 Tax=Stakelama portus TaxID=2676234 RepID=UPI0011AB428D|nr:hypothetical protein [Sphingosinithalassobacter portus]